MQTIDFRAMGCSMRAAVDSDWPEAGAVLAQTPGWFADWERSLSRFDPASELSELNAHAGEWVLVGETTWQVLLAAIDAVEASGGLVRPDLLSALEAAGYDRSFEQLPRAVAAALEAEPAAGGEIEINAAERAVRLPAGMRLDFGGLAKGWCADEAVRRLSVCGPALVDAGGDLAMCGSPREWQAWPVAVSAPAGQYGLLATLRLAGGGVATSGRDFRRWLTALGQERHHLIDPRTGGPAETDVLTATVVATSAREAEIAAKVTLLRGSRAGLDWLEARGLAGLVTLEAGGTRTTSNWAQFVWN